MSYCLSCYVILVPSKPAHQSDRTLHFAPSLHSFVLWSYPVLSFMLPVGPTVTAEIQFASHVIIINFPAPPESLKCHFISPLELFTSAISRTHLPATTHRQSPGNQEQQPQQHCSSHLDSLEPRQRLRQNSRQLRTHDMLTERGDRDGWW